MHTILQNLCEPHNFYKIKKKISQKSIVHNSYFRAQKKGLLSSNKVTCGAHRRDGNYKNNIITAVQGLRIHIPPQTVRSNFVKSHCFFGGILWKSTFCLNWIPWEVLYFAAYNIIIYQSIVILKYCCNLGVHAIRLCSQLHLSLILYLVHMSSHYTNQKWISSKLFTSTLLHLQPLAWGIWCQEGKF